MTFSLFPHGYEGLYIGDWIDIIPARCPINGFDDMTQTVFLTGATGALGPVLAAELLGSNAASQLRVLIRGAQSSAGVRFDQWIQTLESVLASSGSLLPNPRKRIGLVEGDLCAWQETHGHIWFSNRGKASANRAGKL